MLFNSFIFPIFFVAVYIVFRALPLRAQNIWLLIASYFFYAGWDWRFLSLLILSTAVDYVVGQKIAATEERKLRLRWLWTSVGVNLGVLGTFKYLGFFTESFADLMQVLGMSVNPVILNIVLPVGISFYTFQTLSYTIDIYRRQLKPEKDIVVFALFVAYFPQLVAGPIERARNMLPQLRSRKKIDQNDIVMGLWLMFWGYFLKVYVADNLAIVVNAIYSQQPIVGPGAINSVDVAMAGYTFAFQILGDFAGYSCIAMGTSRLLGVKLMTNFRFPYFVTNPAQLWQHWHISLSSWFRDYLYISMGGNRGGELKTYRNLFTTMVVSGLWHGAAWPYVLWGVYQGISLALHRFLENLGLLRWLGHKYCRPLAWLAMFHITCLGYVVLRSESLDQMGYFLSSIATMPQWTAVHSDQLRVLLFFAGPMMLIQFWMWRSGRMTIVLRSPLWIRVPVLGLMAWLIVALGQYQSQEFFYFQF